MSYLRGRKKFLPSCSKATSCKILWRELGQELKLITYQSMYGTVLILYYYEVSVSFFPILGVCDLKEFNQRSVQNADCRLQRGYKNYAD